MRPARSSLPDGDSRAVASGALRDRLLAPFARASGRLSRVLRAGAGTTFPGRAMERLSPGYVGRRAATLSSGVVVVSGTNGKTTTASMIQHILQKEGVPFVANVSGANLIGGVASAFLTARRDARAGIFEIDEAALPRLMELLRPRVLVLTNVFRDQLDRFGEPERAAALLGQAARRLPADATLIANADDVQLWSAVQDLSPVGFGVTGAHAAPDPGIDAEPTTCPRCGEPLHFVERTLGNLGRARCPNCGWASPTPSREARLTGDLGLQAIVFEVEGVPCTLPVGGVHNAYNALAAISAARALGVPLDRCVSAVQRFKPRFGRAEEMDHDGRRLWIGLIKNPAGATVLCQEVAADPRVGAVVVSLNDLDADGRDVSWIWDAGFEPLVARGLPIVAGGRRAEDMALRLKYGSAVDVPVEHEPVLAIRRAASVSPAGSLIVVLATYTAMLELRKAILGRVARVQDAAA